MKYIITNANIINEGRIFRGSVIIENSLIKEVIENPAAKINSSNAHVIDAGGKYLLPGIIDDHVHFREPGLTHKADIYTESKAAVAGGVTSFMDMPNTIPNAITRDLLEEKFQLASKKSLVNYSFYIGATNDNIDELKKIDNSTVCGIKVFMGSSTGNMLVDDMNALQQIFSLSSSLIAVHCENEKIIRENIEKYKAIYGENIPVFLHPAIRSSEACFKSSSLAVELAVKHNTRLHLLHLSSADEINLLDNSFSPEKKKITAEVCVHHLWFTDKDYQKKGTLIKWNPAIKSSSDRDALWKALIDGKIDVIATDHAPHTLEEKNKAYLNAPSGGPLIQHSLTAMIEFYHQGKISLEAIAHKMAHVPALCFGVEKRGFIRPGYYADIVLIDLDSPWTVDKSNILSKCGWSPFEGNTFKSRVTHTFVNGYMVYNNGLFDETKKGIRLVFNRQ
ncbi:MAG: dihydroorotase [Bacteroidales bacterium]